MRRPRECHGGRGDRRERVGKRGRAAGEDGHRGGAEGQRLGEISGDEHAGGRVPVCERPTDRGEDRGRHELHDGHDCSSRRPSLIERVDEHRDPDRVLGRLEARERSRSRTQVVVAQHRPEDREGRAHRASLLGRRRSERIGCATVGAFRPHRLVA